MNGYFVSSRWLIILAVLLLTAAPSYSQEDVTRVNDSGFSATVRPEVPFFHEDHNEKAEIEDCTACHHVYEEGELVEDESSEDMECSECHLSAGGGTAVGLAAVYHKRCRGCHQEQKAGPVLCSECHPK